MLGEGKDFLKFLHIRTLVNNQNKSEFHQEAGVMWACQFPRIVRLYDISTEEGHHWSLNDWMLTSGEDISDERRTQIAIDIAQGLKDLRGQRVVHQDPKSYKNFLNHAKVTCASLCRSSAIIAAATSI